MSIFLLMRFLGRFLSLVALVVVAAVLHAQSTPPVPAVFSFEPQGFKFINHDAEFRDPSDVLWPNFYVGRPAAGGLLTLGPTPTINLTVVYDQMLQKAGDQSRRVLGELCKPGEFPLVTLTLNHLGGLKQEPSKNGKSKFVKYGAQLEGVLQVGERRAPIKGEGVLTLFPGPGGVQRIMVDATVDLKPAELGLTKLPVDAVVRVRLTTNGRPAGPATTPPAK